MKSTYIRRCKCGNNAFVEKLFHLMDPPIFAGYYVFCRKCFKEGPRRMKEDQAIAEWNNGRKMGWL